MRRCIAWLARISILVILGYVLPSAILTAQTSETGRVKLSPDDTFLSLDSSSNAEEIALRVMTWPDRQPSSAALLKFDLSSIPSDAVVQSATLYLALVDADHKDADPTYNVSVQKVIGKNPVIARATGFTSDGHTPWSPSPCCYDGIPLAQGDLSAPYDTQAIDKTFGFKAWRMTAMVQEWLAAPSTNLGVVLNADTTKLRNRYRLFASMENPDATLRPYLAVRFVAHDATPPTVVLTAPAPGSMLTDTVTVTANANDANGVAGVRFQLNGEQFGAELTSAPYTSAIDTTSLSDGAYVLTAVARDRAGNSATSRGVSVTVRNGQLVLFPRDTYLSLDSINHRDDSSLWAYTWPANRVGRATVMKFDLSGVPAGTVIQDATLNLVLVESDTGSEPTYTVTAHKIVGRNPAIGATTGYTSDGTTAWAPSGCCYNGIPLAQSNISVAYDQRAIDRIAGRKVWTVTRMVEEWLATPSSNFGLLLNADTSKPSDRFRRFASVESVDASLRPYLRLRFVPKDTTPPAVAISAPGAGTTVAGTINIAANATDNVGVAGVQFRVDGVDLGGEVTAAPFAIAWNTTTAALGTHTLRAIARDEAGNSTKSVAISVTVSNDTTLPTVALTAPVNGASVSSTVTLSASASDAGGVAGVQFRVDGVSIGTEDTTAPYSIAWDSRLVTNGSHQVTAEARDTAGNRRTSVAVTVSVSNALAPPPTPPTGIASRFPGDVGIESDANVVFVERFDESMLATLFTRWNDVLNGAAMSFSPDVPPGSPTRNSLSITWSATSVGGHLYKQITPGVDDTLYVRYYIKYPAAGNYSHNGIWMGGYNPALNWPNPQAGIMPTGSDRFSAAAEQNATTLGFDHYDYWMGMHQSTDGNYWGNVLLNSATPLGRTNQWMCVEHMIKLNNPVTESNGEHAIWVDGVKISHLGQGFPNGTWSGGNFTQNTSGSPFGGFRWRSDARLNLNYIWLQTYAPDAPPGFLANMNFAHVVAAKSYIGCLTPSSSGPGPSPAPGDTTAPTVSISAPAAGTVGGVVTITATASDNVGVAGVQFRIDGVNLGSEVTTTPRSIQWTTTGVANGSHSITAVARDAAGNTTTSASVAVNVSNLAKVSWPNEPAGFTMFNRQPWDALTGNGWNYLRRSSTQNATIASDTSAPASPSNELKIVYSPGCCIDAEPSVHWLALPHVKEIFTGWWFKLSPNWIPNPAGGGKLTFLFGNAGGQVYTNLYHPSGTQGTTPGPPYQIGSNTEWAPYGQMIRLPNVATNWINNGEWHRVEFYYKWETVPGVSGDGIIRWWVDGTLNGNYTDVHYPDASFIEFQFAPTVQYAGPQERYMYIDDSYVSIR